jgi:c-di-GMP-binding flagellar brake protein YcgR
VSTQEDKSHQRRYYRANVEFPVTIIVPGHELVVGANALDLSTGGMRVSSTTDLPAGQSIVLRFTLPGADREMLVRARIVLSFFDNSSKTYAHGIAFTQYAAADHEAIGAFVGKFEAGKTR